MRLRVETVLGYKMVKYLRSIELVASYDTIRAGQGGSREDTTIMERALKCKEYVSGMSATKKVPGLVNRILPRASQVAGNKTGRGRKTTLSQYFLIMLRYLRAAA